MKLQCSPETMECVWGAGGEAGSLWVEDQAGGTCWYSILLLISAPGELLAQGWGSQAVVPQDQGYHIWEEYVVCPVVSQSPCWEVSVARLGVQALMARDHRARCVH